jgi:hypothetical protein
MILVTEQGKEAQRKYDDYVQLVSREMLLHMEVDVEYASTDFLAWFYEENDRLVREAMWLLLSRNLIQMTSNRKIRRI